MHGSVEKTISIALRVTSGFVLFGGRRTSVRSHCPEFSPFRGRQRADNDGEARTLFRDLVSFGDNENGFAPNITVLAYRIKDFIKLSEGRACTKSDNEVPGGLISYCKVTNLWRTSNSRRELGSRLS